MNQSNKSFDFFLNPAVSLGPFGLSELKEILDLIVNKKFMDQFRYWITREKMEKEIWTIVGRNIALGNNGPRNFFL